MIYTIYWPSAHTVTGYLYKTGVHRVSSTPDSWISCPKPALTCDKFWYITDCYCRFFEWVPINPDTLYIYMCVYTHTYRGCQKNVYSFQIPLQNGLALLERQPCFHHFLWLSCPTHGDASIHLINTIFWANVLLHIATVIQFNFENVYIFFWHPLYIYCYYGKDYSNIPECFLFPLSWQMMCKIIPNPGR